MITHTNPMGWPEGTLEIEHNGTTLYVIPTIEGLEVDTQEDFFVLWNKTDEIHEVTFMNIEGNKK